MFKWNQDSPCTTITSRSKSGIVICKIDFVERNSAKSKWDGRVDLGLQIKVLVRKGVGANPTLIMFQSIKWYKWIYVCDINYYEMFYACESRWHGLVGLRRQFWKIGRERDWVEIPLSLFVKLSSIVDLYMFVTWMTSWASNIKSSSFMYIRSCIFSQNFYYEPYEGSASTMIMFVV